MCGHASQIRFSRLGQARGASPGSLDQRSEEWPLCEGKSGAHGVRLRTTLGTGLGTGLARTGPNTGTPRKKEFKQDNSLFNKKNVFDTGVSCLVVLCVAPV